jgi:hypothetical protein
VFNSRRCPGRSSAAIRVQYRTPGAAWCECSVTDHPHLRPSDLILSTVP